MIRCSEGVHEVRERSREHFKERVPYGISGGRQHSSHVEEGYNYFSLPHNVVCSRICGTPVSSGGFVLKPIEKTLFLSSLATCK